MADDNLDWLAPAACPKKAPPLTLRKRQRIDDEAAVFSPQRAATIRRGLQLERDPDAPTRTRRHLDRWTEIFNCLARKGQIQQTGKTDFSIISGGFSAARAPTAFDDVSIGATVGAVWVDTNASKFYVCISTTATAAVWNGPY